MYYFCTYFDHRFLSNGIALYNSLAMHCSYFKLSVLCLSSECYAALSNLSYPNIELISLDEFEKDDSNLQAAKKNRSLVEYYFTCTPSLPLYILKNSPGIDLITYLDADLYFFSDPEPIFKIMERYSIAIIPHRFSRKLKYLEIYGKYNVGWMSFRNDENGLTCLNWYREECNKWCYDKVEGVKFADQKYLDAFLTKFQGVISLDHKGANAAPYNIENYNLLIKNNKIYLDDDPLIFFHFQGLKHLFGSLYDSGFSYYRLELNHFIREKIYEPYIAQLNQIEKKILIKKLYDLRQNNKVLYQKIGKIFPATINALNKVNKAVKSLRTNTFIISKK